ncbi:MAG: hypothetical protein E6H09_22600 [Bacteroidetes bacterium]|jgi:hypothetical protein|nr:MAG: hypothetical protein E6H09_22600 [Bacteroidota bacterium]
MRPVLLIATIFFHLSVFSQKDSIYRPATLDEMFRQMDIVLSPAQIKLIRELPEDSIKKTNPYISDLTKDYDYYNDSKVVTDLEEKGIYYDDRYMLITVSYHRYLNGIDLKLDEQYRFFDSLYMGKVKRYEEALIRDSVDDKYIPLNLPDCFIELDKLLSPETKQRIKKNGVSGLHLSLGMYIRNRWQLWGGSRLKKYFLDLHGGFMHPESMSYVILKYYYQWLLGNKDAWRQWVIEQTKEKK